MYSIEVYLTISYFVAGVLIALFVYANKLKCLDGVTMEFEEKHPLLFYSYVILFSIPCIVWVLMLNLIEIFMKKDEEGGNK